MEEPYFTLKGKNNERWQIGPDKSILYRHLGSLSMYDNVTAQLTDNPPTFTRVFRHQNGYNELESHMMEAGYPMSVNLRKVAQAILNSFEQSISAQTEDIDTFPESWNE